MGLNRTLRIMPNMFLAVLCAIANIDEKNRGITQYVSFAKMIRLSFRTRRSICIYT